MANFQKINSGVQTGTAMALTDLPSIGANTAIANVTGSSATPTAVSLLSTATASAIMVRDSNANVQANNVVRNITTTATAGTTTTLLVSSTYYQQFTGTTTQTVVLPNATTLVNGQAFAILNRSTGAVTVNANGGGLVQTVAAGNQVTVTLVNNGTAAGVWDAAYSLSSGASSTLTSLGIFSGKATVSNAATSVSVTFSTSYASTNYAVTCNFLNTTDTNPQFQPIEITSQSNTGFTAKWNAPVPTANYLLSWQAIANN